MTFHHASFPRTYTHRQSISGGQAEASPLVIKKKSNHAPSRRVVKQYKPVYHYFRTQPLRNNQKIKFGLSDSRVCSHSLSSMLDHNCSVSLIPSLVLAL